MCNTISGGSYIGRILNKEFSNKNEVSSRDLYNLNKNNDNSPDIDANGDGKITGIELRDFVKKEGIDTRFTKAEIRTLESEAATLTQLIQKGGTLTKHQDEANKVSFEIKFVDTQPAPTISQLKSELNTDNQFAFKVGQSGPDVKKIHTLLNNINKGNPHYIPFKPNDDKFTERTASLIAEFQEQDNNQLQPNQPKVIGSGIVDKSTLADLEKAAELSIKSKNIYSNQNDVQISRPRVNPTPNNQGNGGTVPSNGTPPTQNGNNQVNTDNTTTAPSAVAPIDDKDPKRNAVRQKVIGQLKAQGLTDDQIQKSFGISKALLDENKMVIAESEAKTGVISTGYCYSGVKEAMQRELHMEYVNDGAAKNGDTKIFEGAYKDKFIKLDLTKEDIMNLPPELSVIVIHEGGEFGHAAVYGSEETAPGSGKYTPVQMSDKERNSFSYPGSKFHAYIPRDVVQPDDKRYVSPESAYSDNRLAINVTNKTNKGSIRLRASERQERRNEIASTGYNPFIKR